MLVAGRGFEPLRQPKVVLTTFPLSLNEDVLKDFERFCRIDLNLNDYTIKLHKRFIKRYLTFCNYQPSKESIRTFLLEVRNNFALKTYCAVLCALKVFFRDFLNRAELVDSFKFPNLKPNIIASLHSKHQLQTFFHSLPNNTAKAVFLIYASSGIRRSELFNAKIIPELRAIIPNNHEQYSTKNSYISFYNHEAEHYLKLINFNLNINKNKILRWFKKAYEKTGIKITPQILREWFCSEMGRLGVPDRYVDAFKEPFWYHRFDLSSRDNDAPDNSPMHPWYVAILFRSFQLYCKADSPDDAYGGKEDLSLIHI